MPWLTGTDPDPDTICRVLVIPDHLHYVSAVTGALLPLTDPANWEQFGDDTPDEAAALMAAMLADYVESDCS